MMIDFLCKEPVQNVYLLEISLIYPYNSSFLIKQKYYLNVYCKEKEKYMLVVLCI